MRRTSFNVMTHETIFNYDFQSTNVGHKISCKLHAFEKKSFHDNLTLPKSTEKGWLKRDLNSLLRDTGPPVYLLSYRVHRDWTRVFIQLKCTRYSRDNWTFIHERMCSVSILFQNHPQRYMNRNLFVIIWHFSWLQFHASEAWWRFWNYMHFLAMLTKCCFGKHVNFV